MTRKKTDPVQVSVDPMGPTQISLAFALGAAGITGDHADRVWESVRTTVPRTVGQLAEIVSRAVAEVEA